MVAEHCGDCGRVGTAQRTLRVRESLIVGSEDSDSMCSLESGENARAGLRCCTAKARQVTRKDRDIARPQKHAADGVNDQILVGMALKDGDSARLVENENGGV